MLRRMKDLHGFTIGATDGDIGLRVRGVRRTSVNTSRSGRAPGASCTAAGPRGFACTYASCDNRRVAAARATCADRRGTSGAGCATGTSRLSTATIADVVFQTQVVAPDQEHDRTQGAETANSPGRPQSGKEVPNLAYHRQISAARGLCYQESHAKAHDLRPRARGQPVQASP